VDPFNGWNRAADRSPATLPTTIPTACPACQSRAITTTGRQADENTYWRCAGCGEVWNAARRRQAAPTRVHTWR